MNLIQKENRLPGTTAWQLTNPADDRQIEGYASLTSVPVGGNIDFFVNTADATYSLTVYRMGWYQGNGARRVLGPQVLAGIQQVTPTPDPTTGVFDCHWTNPFTMHVPTSWLSGIYLVKLHGNTSGKESYIIFTVRDSRSADLVFQQSVITYHAYNPWPGWNPTGGYSGASLYEFQTDRNLAGSPGYKIGTGGGMPPGVQAQQVSFNRPYGRDFQTPYPPLLYSSQISSLYGIGAGDFLHNIAPAAMDFGMVRWLEHQGYDVTYITDVDTHEDVGQLLRGKAYLSVGHDEYVSREMKAHIVQARDQGVSLGFFGANYIFWPVELFPDSSGSPNRTISLAPSNRCVIPHPGDPNPADPSPPFTVSATETTACTVNSDCATGEACKVKICDYACQLDSNGVSETEQALVGGMWDDGHVTISNDIVVTADALLDHWVFANTGLKFDDVIPGLIGTEYNVVRQNFPKPNGLQTLLRTQAPDFRGAGFPLPADFDGKNFDHWYESFVMAGRNLDQTCDTTSPIPPLNIVPSLGYCSNPEPQAQNEKTDWAMTIYQASSGAWVFNAPTNQWAWGLDDYFTGLTTADGANNGPPFRTQCGYPWFHPGLVSCRNPAVEQITRNVLNKFIAGP